MILARRETMRVTRTVLLVMLTAASAGAQTGQGSGTVNGPCAISGPVATCQLSGTIIVQLPAATAPAITAQPAAASVTVGQTATFIAIATGTAPLAYQWRKNGTAITGATAASYTTPATVSTDNGASFTVVVSNSAGSVTSAAAALAVTPGVVQPTFAIHAGGAAYTDSTGVIWSADKNFTGSIGTYAVSNATAAALPASTDQNLYRSERYGPMVYTFTVPNGNYTVVLKFAEIYYSSSGQRIFGVAINGAAVLSNFDIVAAAGAAFKAVDKTFPVSVTGGSIAVNFTNGSVDYPKISAIEIIPGGTTPPTAALTVTPANSTCRNITGQPPQTVQFKAVDNNGVDQTALAVWKSSDTTNAPITTGGLVTCGSPATSTQVTISAAK